MRLRQIRARQGMTQDTLARKVGVSRAYLSRLEMRRAPHDPPLSLVRKLARALGVDIAELVR
jgi:transcriptional regulator with XRE-family HTH domain